MKESELLNVIFAIIILTIVIEFQSLIYLDVSGFGIAILFAAIIIIVNVSAKKLAAKKLDAGVENKLWYWSRYGFKPTQKLKREIPMGVILPLAITAFSLGAAKIMTILTYETKALKRRAAKRFGNYSFTEMTEWHNALVGAAGIFAVLFVSFVSYWIPGLEGLPKLAAFYALFNLIPFSKLDGCQIFFGSRVLWTTLVVITLIFISYSLLLF